MILHRLSAEWMNTVGYCTCIDFLTWNFTHLIVELVHVRGAAPIGSEIKNVMLRFSEFIFALKSFPEFRMERLSSGCAFRVKNNIAAKLKTEMTFVLSPVQAAK